MSFDTLFDAREGDAPIPAREVRRPKPLPVDDSPSPFGATKPEHLPPVEDSGGFGKAFEKGAPRKPLTGTNLSAMYKRIREHLEKTHGGFCFKVEHWAANDKGFNVKRDLLGFGDLMLVTGVGDETRVTMVQCTSAGSVGAHMRKYADPTKTHGQAKTPVIELIRRWLAENGRIVVVSYEKDETTNRWILHEHPVTMDLLDQFAARRRGPKR